MEEDRLRHVQYEAGEDWADLVEDANGLWSLKSG